LKSNFNFKGLFSAQDQAEAQFTIERLLASERIMELTSIHDHQFSEKMKALNIDR
jgi:hypothetical protein